MEHMKNQAMRFGAKLIPTMAINAKLSSRPFVVDLENGEQIKAQTVIISTGASAKYLGLAHEKELIGKGVSTCATCDGFFYKGKIVHVAGGGDTAIEEATFLARFASKVYLIHRRDAFRGDEVLVERLKRAGVEFVLDSDICGFSHFHKVDRVGIYCPADCNRIM